MSPVTDQEPIAVIGMACRFPGANNVTEYWSLLSEGQSAWSNTPSSRFEWSSFYHPDPENPGTHNQRGGHYLEQDISAFDAEFFGISEEEAIAMDPQQRLLLEVTYEALEDAGIPSSNLRGSNTGVFMASFLQDYESLMLKDLQRLPKFFAVGAGRSMLSNRISYTFDLKGPSMVLDTACSGSLVAVHQACQSLRCGEVGMALTGGVNLIISPEIMVGMSSIGFLNSDGKCYSFDSRGSGYGRGEGLGVIALKRLSEAVRDGDTIRGIIRGTAVGQDGKTAGITNPSIDSQEALIRLAYKQAGLNPMDTSYIEAHGTGTSAGDRAEVQSLANVFDSLNRSTCFIGSAKANIGHLEAASGIAGLIKAVLVLEHKCIPANVNLRTYKDDLLSGIKNLAIPGEPQRELAQGLQRVSVNSFGYGGTNAHAILETADHNKFAKGRLHMTLDVNGKYVSDSEECVENFDEKISHKKTSFNGAAPACTAKDVVALSQLLDHSCKIQSPQTTRLFVLTAKSKKSLLEYCDRMRLWLLRRKDEDLNLSDLAFTLNCRRSKMLWSTSFVAATRQDAIKTLEKEQSLLEKPDSITVSLVFSGQGAQWSGMGKELIRHSTVFARSLRDSQDILQGLGVEWNLLDELSREDGGVNIDRSEIAQPAVTALQIALVDLLRDLGVPFDRVLGHSSGEIAAAYACGALDKESSIKVSFFRGQLDERSREILSMPGAMIAVKLGEQDILPFLSQLPSRSVSIACCNSPSSTTISGDEPVINQLTEILQRASVPVTRLRIKTAYHSHHMEAVAGMYLEFLRGISHTSTKKNIQFFSSVTASYKSSGFDPNYWVDNLVSKVRFHEGLEALCRSNYDGNFSSSRNMAILEIGPHKALSGPVQETITTLIPEALSITYLPSLVRRSDAVHTVLESLGNLITRGVQIDLQQVNNLNNDHELPPKPLCDLPTYAWNHSARYWHDSYLSESFRFRKNPYHELLGVRVIGNPIEPLWRHMLNTDRLPWLQDHLVDGAAIFPASGYIAMAVEAARAVCEVPLGRRITAYRLRNVELTKSLIIPDAPDTTEVQFSMKPCKSLRHASSRSWYDFCVYSLSSDGQWSRHGSGSVQAEISDLEDPDGYEPAASLESSFYAINDTRRKILTSYTKALGRTEIYKELFKERGNEYTGTFAGIKEIKFWEDYIMGSVAIPHVSKAMSRQHLSQHVIHPTTFDMFIQSAVPALLYQTSAWSALAVKFGEIQILPNMKNGPGEELDFVTRFKVPDSRTLQGEVFVTQKEESGSDKPVMKVSGLELKAVYSTDRRPRHSKHGRNICAKLCWELDPDLNALSASAEDAPYSLNKLKDLNRASAIYISTCLMHVSESDVASNQLAFFRALQQTSDSEYYKSLIYDSSELALQSALKHVKELGVEGETVTVVGESLEDILLGKSTLLNILTENDLFYRIYREDEASSTCYKYLVQYVGRMMRKNPNMRILELGAGTAAVTEILFRELSSQGHIQMESYDFTDLSSGYFGKARSVLSPWLEHINFQTLDISQKGAEQGFRDHSYDLIIASNVLHAPRNTNLVLQNVRALIKPGGQLALIESTSDVLWLNTVFGGFAGWYSGIDQGRSGSFLYTTKEWDQLLLNNGFSGLEHNLGSSSGESDRMSFMTSKATTTRLEALKKPHVCVVSYSQANRSDSPLLREVKEMLTGNGFTISTDVLPVENPGNEMVYVLLEDKKYPLLLNLTDVELKGLTDLLADAACVLWICIGHHISSNALGPEYALTPGFVRSSRMENLDCKLVTLDVEMDDGEKIINLKNVLLEIINVSFFLPDMEQSTEQEYLYTNRQVHIPRLYPDHQMNNVVDQSCSLPEPCDGFFQQYGKQIRLLYEAPGTLQDARFVKNEHYIHLLPEDWIEINTEACGVNFSHVRMATGEEQPDNLAIGEVAGRVARVGKEVERSRCFKIGDRVCALGRIPFANTIQTSASLACLIPDSMDFATAASIPVDFVTASYAFNELAHIQDEHNTSVLIQNAAASSAQAAIKVAQSFGATLFVTVDSLAEGYILQEQFKIPDDHIFTSLEENIRCILSKATGTGIDIVLSFATGDDVESAIQCTRPFGTFVHVKNGRTLVDNSLLLKHCPSGVRYTSLDISTLTKYQSVQISRTMRQIMSSIESGRLTPIHSFRTISMANIPDALNSLHQDPNGGKIVLKAAHEQPLKLLLLEQEQSPLDRDGTYLVVGGLGGLGLDTARHMASIGAGHIVLLSRRTLSSDEKELLEKEFSALGANLHTFQCDVTDLNQLKWVNDRIKLLPPVRGILQSAMVNENRPLAHLDLKSLRGPTDPKVLGTQNILSTFAGPSLNFVVMLSSIVSIIGSRGSPSYAAGNTFLDGLARQQRGNDSCRYVSMALGPMAESGVVARDYKLARIFQRQGLIMIANDEFFRLFDYAISAQGQADRRHQIILGFNGQSLIQASDKSLLELPILRNLLYKAKKESKPKQAEVAKQSIKEKLLNSHDEEDAKNVVSTHLVERIASSLGVESGILENTPLEAAGVDSLVAIELKNWIKRTFQVGLETSEVSDAKTLQVLVDNIIRKLPQEFGVFDVAQPPLPSQLGPNDDTMKAYTIQGDGRAAIATVLKPKLRPNYVRVKTEAVALNPTDWKHIKNLWHRDADGAVVGCDFVGTVDEVGGEVTSAVRKGDRIAGMVHGCNHSDHEDGSCAEYLIAKDGMFLRVPEELSLESASTLGVAITTAGQALYQFLQLPYPTKPTAEPFPLLVYGGSTAMGTMAIQYAKLSGCQVLATASNHTIELVKSFGADKVFDYTDPECGQQIREFTQNKLRHAMDCISAHEAQKICAEALSSDASLGLSYVALTPGSEKRFPRKAEVEATSVLAYTAIGEPFVKTGKHYPAVSADHEFAKEFWRTAESLISNGQLRPHPVDLRTGGLEAITQGLDDLESHRIRGSKVVLTL